MRLLKQLLVGTFFICIALPAVVMWWQPQQTISTGEQRTLAEFPQVNWDRSLISSFPKAFEDYLNDHFGYREALIRLYSLLRVNTGAVSELANVIIGDSGWFYQGGDPHTLDIRNVWPFSQYELVHWANAMRAKKDWLAQQGIDYLFVIAPNKFLIYPEYLPGELKIAPRESRLDQLVNFLNENTNVPVADLRPRLFREKQQQEEDIYFKTDSHWNARGAYFAYREIIAKLNEAGLDIEVFEVDEREFRSIKYGGDLARNLGLEKELAENTIEWDEKRATCAQYHEISEDDDWWIRHRAWFYTTCESRPYRVLMLRDSYSLWLMPYLSETFGYIFYVPHAIAPLHAIQELVKYYNPDVVIEQRASRWLRSPDGQL